MIVNPEANLNLNSAFDSTQTNTTIKKVSPNYVGIAAVAGGSAWAGNYAGKYVMGTSYGAVGANGPIIPTMIPIVNTPLFSSAASYGAGKTISIATQPVGDLFNLKEKSSFDSFKKSEVKADLNFNHLNVE